MTKIQTIFCLISTLALLSLAQARLGQQPLEPVTAVDAPLSIGICDFLSSEPSFVCSTQNQAPGCICYRNETCANATVIDECACNDTNVLNYTFNANCSAPQESGEAVEQGEARSEVGPAISIGICDALNVEDAFLCSEDTKYPGCICYRNNTCSNATVIDECACDDSNVLNYTFNANCSASQESGEAIEQEEQQEARSEVGPVLAFGICDSLNAEDAFLCSEDTKYPGCICYRNNTCSNATAIDECACDDFSVLNYTFNANCSSPQESGETVEQPEATTAVGTPLAFGTCEDYVSNSTCPVSASNATPNACFYYQNGSNQSGYADGVNNCPCEDSQLVNYTIGFTCDN